jgi:hypothetical protein
MFRRMFALGLMVLTIVLAAPLSSSAQVVESKDKSTFGDRPLVIPSTEALIPKGPKVAVETAAEVIGMVRGGKRDRTTTSFNTLEFTATGTMAEPGADGTWHTYKITKLIEASDFVIPASRLDIRFADPSGGAKHEIRVVAGQKAWNEETPGVNGTPMPEAVVADRVRQIWLTPQGAMWGALRAVDAKEDVKISNESGRLVVAYPWQGDQVKILFDAGLKPQRVEIKTHSNLYGDTTLVATYLAYKDFEGYLAPFPTRMTYKAGDRVILDLSVTDSQVNPYVIFPTPENMGKATAQQ